MPTILNITINGTGISDDDAKIISLSLMGLPYSKISMITFINPRCLRNKVSALYSVLRTEKCINALTVEGALNGFDHYGYVDGVDVLTAEERSRLHQLKPALLCHKKRLQLKLVTD
jgi:hypothetical protein